MDCFRLSKWPRMIGVMMIPGSSTMSHKRLSGLYLPPGHEVAQTYSLNAAWTNGLVVSTDLPLLIVLIGCVRNDNQIG